MKSKKWNDAAPHKIGCPYKGVGIKSNDSEMAKYYSGYCPGCNVPVKWTLAEEEAASAAKQARV